MAPITDPNTLANHHSVVTEYTTIDVALDFKASSVSGDATLKLKVLKDGVGEVVLDTSYLDIKCVAIDGKETTWKLDDRKEPYGSALRITLTNKPKAGDSIDVMVRTADGMNPLVNRSLMATDFVQYHREMHCASVDDSRPDLQQEASLHVYSSNCSQMM